jgi:hypothetical protein
MVGDGICGGIFLPLLRLFLPGAPCAVELLLANPVDKPGGVEFGSIAASIIVRDSSI